MVKGFQQVSVGTTVLLAQQKAGYYLTTTDHKWRVKNLSQNFNTNILLAHQEDTKSNRKHLA